MSAEYKRVYNGGKANCETCQNRRECGVNHDLHMNTKYFGCEGYKRGNPPEVEDENEED